MEVRKNIFSSLSRSQYLELLPDLKADKTQAVFTLAFTLVALTVFGYFAIAPTLNTIANLKRQLEDNHYVNDKLQEKISSLRQLQQQYTSLQSDLPIILSAIPQDSTAPYFLGQIQSLAQDSHIQMIRLQANQVNLSNNLIAQLPKGVPLTDYSSFSFSLDARGTQSNVSEFVGSLNGFDRIVTIDSLTITKGVEANDPLHLSISGKAYFKK